MEIRLYIQILRRGIWLILITGLASLGFSLVQSYFAVPQYQATARFIIIPNASAGSGTDAVRIFDTLDRVSVASTYAEIMNSNKIFEDALSFMQLPSDGLGDYTYVAVVLPDTTILELNVTGPDPAVVAQLANAVGYRTIEFTRNMNQIFDLNFLDTALPPESSFSPKPARDAGLALVLGVLGGMVLAVINDQIRIPLDAYRKRLRLDPVTGVNTRKHFTTLLEEVLSNKPNDPHSIGIVDLDGLREYLDTLPLSGLNSILRHTTEVLQKELRGNDSIGRWGDTSFIVLLSGTPALAANRIFERICQALTQPADLGQFAVNVSLNPHIGGAEYSNNIAPSELIEKAETALEQARRDVNKPVYVWELKSPFWVQNPEDEIAKDS